MGGWGAFIKAFLKLEMRAFRPGSKEELRRKRSELKQSTSVQASTH